MSREIVFRIFLAFIISIYLAYNGSKKKSLSFSGSITAFIVGFVSFSISYRFGIILILFYLTSSKLTKYKEDVKSQLEENYKSSGQRNMYQVLASSVLALIISIAYMYFCGIDRNISFTNNEDQIQILSNNFWFMYISHYASANADTWASELGILSNSKPRLITSFFLKEVPKGTNGGVSLLGTIASILGGGFIGIVYYILTPFYAQSFFTQDKQYPIIIFAALCGLLGSMIDSLLGALFQASYYAEDKKCIVKVEDITNYPQNSLTLVCGKNLLSNETVNFLSILLTMIIAPYLGKIAFIYF